MKFELVHKHPPPPPPKTQHLETNSKPGKAREARKCRTATAPYLCALLHGAADETRPRSGSVLGGSDGGGPPGVSRPSLCSEAAPVRFSNCRTAAKSLPMPEEFPEQHSRSRSDCFETQLCLYFNTALSGQLRATGLSPAINGKHMCQAWIHSLQQHPRRLLGLHPQPQRKLLLEPIRISQPFSAQAPLCGARCWGQLLFLFLSTLALSNLLLPFTSLADPCQPLELLPVLITSLLQLGDRNSNLISLHVFDSVFAQNLNVCRGNGIISISRQGPHHRVVPLSWCVHVWPLQLKIMRLFLRHFCCSLLYDCTAPKM